MRDLVFHDEVKSWLDDLDERAVGRVKRKTDLLKAEGERLQMPHSRPLGDGLFELRCALPNRTERRITYGFLADGQIVLLTTFRKQRHNEQREIKRARRALVDCQKAHKH